MPDPVNPVPNQFPLPPNRLVVTLFLVAVIAVAGIVAWRAYSAPRGIAVDAIVTSVKADNLKTLGEAVRTNYSEYRDNSMRWSIIFFSCTMLSAVFSAFAGFVLKIKAFSDAQNTKEDMAALLAMLAALLITVSTAGDFQRKWTANRIAAADTEALAYDLLKDGFGNADKDNLIKKLKEIAATRNREIVGDKPAVEPSTAASPAVNTGPAPQPTANSNVNAK